MCHLKDEEYSFPEKGGRSRQRSPWAEARRPEIPGLPHVAEVDLGMKTAEGPAKEFELDSGVANREPWKFPKGSDILGWALLDRMSISLLPLFRQRTPR